MAVLGWKITCVTPARGQTEGEPAAWVSASAAVDDGWHGADRGQRELKSWVAQPDDNRDSASWQDQAVVVDACNGVPLNSSATVDGRGVSPGRARPSGPSAGASSAADR